MFNSKSILEGVKKVLSSLSKKENKIDYPDNWLQVVFSQFAIEDGTEDDLNKKILHYHFNKYGRRICTAYPYSDERLYSLQKTYNLPVTDKTEKEIKFPVFSKINPGEVVFVE